MKKRFYLFAVLLLLAGGLCACSNQADQLEKKAAEQLQLVLDDFTGYYVNFYHKAAAEEDLFTLADLVLISRVDEADTVAYLNEAAALPQSELSELCVDLASEYEAIHAFPFDAAQPEYIAFCNDMYPVLEHLCNYLGEPVPADVLPVESESVLTVPSTDSNMQTGDSGQTDPAEPIPNSRWDSSDGYSLLFRNGIVYLGTTMEDDSFILGNGTAANYTVEGTALIFQAVNDPRTATFDYNGSEMVDTNGEMFDAGSRFTMSHPLS